MFEAPSDGDYLVRIRDVRNAQGNDFAYRLTLAPPQPDFTLALETKNPNIPRGDAVPVMVTVSRLDGFEGPVDVELLDLPPGNQRNAGADPPGWHQHNPGLAVRSRRKASGPAGAVSGQRDSDHQRTGPGTLGGQLPTPRMIR